MAIGFMVSTTSNKYRLLLILILVQSIIIPFINTQHLPNGTSTSEYNAINTNNSTKVKEFSFWESFTYSFGVIFISEIGDRTFLLTIFFTMRSTPLLVFAIASLCMLFMNLISLLVGYALPIFLYKDLIDWIGVILFLIFGIKLLYDSYHMEEKKIIEGYRELESEQNKELNYKSRSKSENKNTKSIDDELQVHESNNLKEALLKPDIEDSNTTKHISEVSLLWSFAVSILLAECGDRSQISAVIVGAMYNFVGVLIGSSVAHVVCIVIAILFGMYISKCISEKTINLVGGCIFLTFAVGFVLRKYKI